MALQSRLRDHHGRRGLSPEIAGFDAGRTRNRTRHSALTAHGTTAVWRDRYPAGSWTRPKLRTDFEDTRSCRRGSAECSWILYGAAALTGVEDERCLEDMCSQLRSGIRFESSTHALSAVLEDRLAAATARRRVVRGSSPCPVAPKASFLGLFA